MEHDLKRLLAFHSVENIGIILLGIGAGMIFQTYGLKEFAALGLLAGLYHTINHAMFKALLFMGAGSLLYATHTRNMEEYGGLLRRMPWTGLFFLIGAVSISALPPTNGFVSEWLVFQTLFLSLQLPALFLKLMLPIAAALLALTGVVSPGLFCQGLRHFVSGPPAKFPCAPCRRNPGRDADRDGNPGPAVRRTWLGSHDRGAAPRSDYGAADRCLDRRQGVGARWLGLGAGERAVLQYLATHIGGHADRVRPPGSVLGLRDSADGW